MPVSKQTIQAKTSDNEIMATETIKNIDIQIISSNMGVMDFIFQWGMMKAILVIIGANHFYQTTKYRSLSRKQNNNKNLREEK